MLRDHSQGAWNVLGCWKSKPGWPGAQKAPYIIYYSEPSHPNVNCRNNRIGSETWINKIWSDLTRGRLRTPVPLRKVGIFANAQTLPSAPGTAGVWREEARAAPVACCPVPAQSAGCSVTVPMYGHLLQAKADRQAAAGKSIFRWPYVTLICTLSPVESRWNSPPAHSSPVLFTSAPSSWPVQKNLGEVGKVYTQKLHSLDSPLCCNLAIILGSINRTLTKLIYVIILRQIPKTLITGHTELQLSV